MQQSNPWPSSPTRPPKVGFYITNECCDHPDYIGFAQEWAARGFLAALEEGYGSLSFKAGDAFTPEGWRVSSRGNGLSAEEIYKTQKDNGWRPDDETAKRFYILQEIFNP